MDSRHQQVLRAIQLEYFTVGYNVLEGIAALFLGGTANSVALIGFGLDSFVETFSGLVVLRRFRGEASGRCDANAEAVALKGVGWSFFILALYVGASSAHRLLTKEPPAPSPLGIVLAVLSLIVMPLLAVKKQRVGRSLNSQSLISDSKQTVACTLLSVFLLSGLLLNFLFGWWWADPIAALAMIPWLVKEGRDAISGRACCD